MLFIVFHVLEVFYSEHCIASPAARRAVRQLAASRPDVVVVERDVESHLELAKRYQVIATPAVVIDGDAVMYGVPRLATLGARVDASHALMHPDQDPR